MSKKSSLAVDYERDEDGWWVASVPSLPGCHTQGRTLEQARRRIAEAIALHMEVQQARLQEHIKLKPKLQATVDAARDARHRAEEQQSTALKAMRRAIAQLINAEGMSIRDAGQLLGISYQRVHQILRGTATTAKPAARRSSKAAG
jgi:predicted RNase H-like HicB family nuclease